MRFLPRSLYGRLVLILVSGLLLAQILGMVIGLRASEQALVRYSNVQWAQRDADAVTLMESLGLEARQRIATVLTSPRLAVSLVAQPTGNVPQRLPPDAEAAEFQTLLRGLLPGRPLQVFLRRGSPLHSVTEVRLRDGTWVRFDHPRPPLLAEWPYPHLIDMGVLLVAVIVLSWIAVRLATRPLTELARAADELGRDINRAPLAEHGPAEVRRAARAFNEMQQRLKRYLEDRTRLLTAVSHDLRTPITRLRLRAELLDDAALREKFNRDLAEMENMTAATLDFLRGLQSGEPPQPVDLMALLESVQADAAEAHQQVAIVGEVRAPFYGQPLALRRCLDNLVSNAVRYGQRALITVEDGDDAVTLRVRDEGPGIPEDELEKVFEPYYRLDKSRGREGGGSGLGLGIARSIAAAHGGSLTLRNHPQGGLEALLVLRRRPVGTAGTAAT